MAQCANCKSELTGHFCAHCGQSAKSRRGPIWQVASEFFGEIFSFDSKFFQSLLALLFRPGRISKQFIDGKRVSILPPVRLYLVTSLLFFIVFKIPDLDVEEYNIYVGDVLLGKNEPTKNQSQISLFGNPGGGDFLSDQVNGLFADKKELMQNTNPQVTIDRIFNQLENILPHSIILFLPLFALVMKLLYLFKRVLYFDHFIFCLHIQTWLMLMAMIIYGLALKNPYWSWLSALVFIYFVRAQKVFYEQTYWLVIPKTFTIIIIYTLLLSLAGLAVMLGAVALL